MTATVLSFKRVKQRALAHIAEAVEADVADLFSPDDVAAEDPDWTPLDVAHIVVHGPLAMIVEVMLAEALVSGESMRHLEKGCSIKLGCRGDRRRRLLVWRSDNVPSLDELTTFKRFFGIPFSTIATWEMSGAQRVAVLRWSVAPTIGEVYQDVATIAELHEMVKRGEYREARNALPCIHGHAEQMAVFDLIMAAERAAKEAADAL